MIVTFTKLLVINIVANKRSELASKSFHPMDEYVNQFDSYQMVLERKKQSQKLKQSQKQEAIYLQRL